MGNIPEPFEFLPDAVWRYSYAVPNFDIVSIDEEGRITNDVQDPDMKVWVLLEIGVSRSDDIALMGTNIMIATDGIVYYPITIDPPRDSVAASLQHPPRDSVAASLQQWIKNCDPTHKIYYKLATYEHEDIRLNSRDLPIINKIIDKCINQRFNK